MASNTRVQQQRKTSNENAIIHSTNISKRGKMKYNTKQNISTLNIIDSDRTLQILQSLFYKKSTIELAKQLLGKILVRTMNDGTIASGCIVETEAYPWGNRSQLPLLRGKKNAKDRSYVHASWNSLRLQCILPVLLLQHFIKW